MNRHMKSNTIKPIYLIFDFEIENVTTTFKNISSGADRYSWDFGDGALSTEENPVHRYPGSGIYNTTLVASNISLLYTT